MLLLLCYGAKLLLTQSRSELSTSAFSALYLLLASNRFHIAGTRATHIVSKSPVAWTISSLANLDETFNVTIMQIVASLLFDAVLSAWCRLKKKKCLNVVFPLTQVIQTTSLACSCLWCYANRSELSISEYVREGIFWSPWSTEVSSTHLTTVLAKEKVSVLFS